MKASDLIFVGFYCVKRVFPSREVIFNGIFRHLTLTSLAHLSRPHTVLIPKTI